MELHENTEKQERALLVAVDTGSYDVEASLAELYELTKTAGAEPFGAMTQKRPAYETAVLVQVWFRKLQIFAKNRRLIC